VKEEAAERGAEKVDQMLAEHLAVFDRLIGGDRSRASRRSNGISRVRSRRT
jgi:hypothetical protein